MGAKRKTVFKGFDYMHCDDFAKYLSDMAAKGWHFKEWGVGLKFDKGEPAHTVYAVEVFTKASEDDMRPEPNTQEFAEYCEAAGWKFIDAKQKFCIFKKIDADATELFTPEERVNNACKGTFSASAITLLVLSGINVWLQLVNLNSFFERNIFMPSSIFNISVWSLMFLRQLALFLYAVWKKMTLKKALGSGRKIHIGHRLEGKFHFSLNMMYIVLLTIPFMYYVFTVEQMEMVVLFIAIMVVTVGFSVILNKVRPEHDTNVIIQVMFTIVLMISIFLFTFVIFIEDGDNSRFEKDTVPLVITDYRECDEVIEDTSYHGERNFLGSIDTYFVFCEENSIYYDIYCSKYAWILDRIWEEVLGDKKFNEELTDCTVDWSAQKALRNSIGIYYVRYENAILVFSDHEDVYLTTDQINIILEKLDLR